MHGIFKQTSPAKQNMSNNKISHTGIVEAVEGDHVRVRIVQSSACSACKVSEHCHASESKEKTVDVRGVDGSDYKIGEKVLVSVRSTMGFMASLYGYVIPLVLMVLTLVLVSLATCSEGLAAVSSICVLIPYYIVLYLLRSKMSGKLRFQLERK